MRVGYGVGPADVVEAIGKVRNAFDINQTAQDAALASLDNDAEIARRHRTTVEGRQQLIDACSRLGLAVATPAVANFIYAEVGEDAQPVFEALLREGVIVRPLAPSAPPARSDVTVGTAREGDYFAAALERVLEGAKTALEYSSRREPDATVPTVRWSVSGARRGLLRQAPGFRLLFRRSPPSIGTWLAFVALVVDVWDHTGDSNWVSALSSSPSSCRSSSSGSRPAVSSTGSPGAGS